MATDKNFTDAFEEAISKQATGNYSIVQYSDKSVAIFGDTKTIKDQLSALGGRFNRYLTLNGKKRAGWIFQKSKEDDLHRLVHLNCQWQQAEAGNTDLSEDDKHSLLMEITSELADIFLVSEYGIPLDNMIDGNGSFYEKYQDRFNDLYDEMEERLLTINK